jgi:YjbE family integral membrane protein
MSPALDAHFFVRAFVALGQVIVIDLVLAGDNALVVGIAAAGLPREMRGKVILIGILAATALRIVFAIAATQLVAVIGLTLAGGILLLWVCWRFWREIEAQRRQRKGVDPGDSCVLPPMVPKTMRQAIIQIVVADVSMSLDNVLAVAGAAAQHTWVLVIGLVLSVGLMGVAASLIACLLKRHHWMAYVGLGIILWVAIDMIYRGGGEVMQQMSSRYLTASVTADLGSAQSRQETASTLCIRSRFDESDRRSASDAMGGSHPTSPPLGGWMIGGEPWKQQLRSVWISASRSFRFTALIVRERLSFNAG